MPKSALNKILKQLFSGQFNVYKKLRQKMKMKMKVY